MGEAAALVGLLFEVQGDGFLAARVGNPLNGLVLTRPAAFFLEPAKAFVKFGQALLAPRF
jgi:hypothetical protein